MKNHRIPWSFIALAAAAFYLASMPGARAEDDAATAAAAKILTSGPWKVTGDGTAESLVFIFSKDGTFATQGASANRGQWTITGQMVVMDFADKHKDILWLPINPAGTPGVTDSGIHFSCSLTAAAATAGNDASAATPTPAAAAIAVSPPEISGPEKVAAVALLTCAPWKFSGKEGAWERTRIFNKDGTFTTRDDPRETGKWKISGATIVLDFADTHTDTISLPLNPNGTTGTDANGGPMTAILETATAGPTASGTSASTPAATAEATPPPVSPEIQKASADLIASYHNSLVFVTGKEGAGSGFIAALDGVNFLVTNAHVAAGINDAGFKALDGTVVKGGAASVAVGHDIFCMAMPAGGKPFEVMKGVDGNAAIGDDIVVLGNAEGAGVINTINGKIVGIGPNLVEVDAPFVPGNSGSPIIHLKTGKVIGVATYTMTRKFDATTHEKIAVPVIRRFGYRLDSVKKWQSVNWPFFYAQAAEMQKIETLTADLDDFFRDISDNKGRVNRDRHTNPVIQTRIDQWLADKAHHLSDADRIDVNSSFLSFLKIACQTDVTAARQHMGYDYFQRELADEQQTRDEMSKAFDEIIKSIRE